MRPSLFLHPGHLVASVEDAVIITILGSCVAVCLGDRSRHIGGMNHFQMPHGARNAIEPLRYGPSATQALFDRVIELGADRRRLEAKVFGGASILPGTGGRVGGLGSENAAAALRTLGRLGVLVVESDVGGRLARKLVYRVEDGAVQVHRISGT